MISMGGNGWYNCFFPIFGDVFKNDKKLNRWNNRTEVQTIFANMTNTLLHMFKWKNLPKTCNEWYLEQALLFTGRAAFVNDPDLGVLSLRCNNYDTYNLYGETTQLQVIGFNGYNRTFKSYIMGGDNTDANAVMIRDNYICFPNYIELAKMAERLANSIRGIDVARNSLKRPYFVVCDQTEKRGILNLLSDVSNNEPAVVSSSDKILDELKILPAPSDPSTLKSLWEDYERLENLWRERNGITNNPMIDKTERAVVDEVNANNMATQLNVKMRLACRKMACEQFNDIAGTDIDVEINPNFMDTTNLDIEFEEFGDDENVSNDVI